MSEYLSTAVERRYSFMLRAAGEMAKTAWRLIDAGTVTAEKKPDGTTVTSVDTTLNRQLIDMVAAELPRDLVWGEEASNSDKGNISLAENRWLWVTDPIDGTNKFWKAIQSEDLSKVNTTILIAGFAPGETTPSVSVISNPFNRQTAMLSAHHGGAFYHDLGSHTMRPVHVAPEGPSRIAHVQRYDQNSWPEAPYDMTVMRHMMPFARRANLPLGMASIAFGDIDLGAFPGDQPHDVAAAAHITHQAGGSAGSLEGEPYEAVDWRVAPVHGLVVAHNDELRNDFLNRLRPQHAA